ncbi:MAG: hypothetical protein ABI599_04325 [Flavobacteriales bacterium]
MDLNTLLYDQLGHFAAADIATILFGMFAAALLAWLAGLIGKAVEGERRQMALLAAVTTMAIWIVRASLPLSLALVAVALFLRSPQSDGGWRSLGQRAVVLAIGVGCGASAALVTVIPALLLALLLRWANTSRV